MDPRTFNPGVEPSPVDQVGATEACRELELLTGNVGPVVTSSTSCSLWLFAGQLYVHQAKTSFRKYSFFSEEVLAVLRVGKDIFVSREWSIFVRVKCEMLDSVVS